MKDSNQINNIKIEISYDGTNYYGWQKQPNRISIQEEIEIALEKVYNQKIELIGSGRTDSGVHAIGQIANFKTSNKINPEKIKFALNNFLPQEIRIIKSEEVEANFHSRYDAIGKTYKYQIYNNKIKSPFLNKYSYFIPYELDIDEMIESSKLLIGKHDFKAFKASNSNINNTERIIYNLKIEKENNLIILKVTGSGFLYNMVRIISGTLIEIGAERKHSLCITEALETGNRQVLGHTAKPEGLFLEKVYYEHI